VQIVVVVAVGLVALTLQENFFHMNARDCREKMLGMASSVATVTVFFVL